MIEKTTRRDIFIKYVINRQSIFFERKVHKFMDYGYLMGNRTDARILHISDIKFTERALAAADLKSVEKAYFFSGTKGTCVALSNDFLEQRNYDEENEAPCFGTDDSNPWFSTNTLCKYLDCKDYAPGIINKYGDFESDKENPIIFILKPFIY